MMALIKSEPVLFQGVIQAALAMTMSFGVGLTPHQVEAVMAFTAAVLAFWTRQQVSPTTGPTVGPMAGKN